MTTPSDSPMCDDHINFDKCPFPWFGGKSKAAPLVWTLLGDVPHYVEPFAGSLAVLLNRPHPCNRAYFSETVNDLDGFVVNFWRAVQWHPESTARAASWPVSECDKQARQIALMRWRTENIERLAGDAAWCCPVMAGWWAYGVSCQIGAIGGPWIADPATGRIMKQARGAKREPGVYRDKPHISNEGRGVNHPGIREPGVLDPITPEHGASALDDTDWGAAYHDRTMPDLVRWLRHLCARLRHVRIVNGDWARVCTTGAAHTLPVRQGDGPCGVFLDPPYADSAQRSDGLYQCDSMTVANEVREWCLANGEDPKFRIVLAGFEGEHGDHMTKAGWTEHEWFVDGFFSGGYGNVAKGRGTGSHQQKRERLWASPHCLSVEVPEQEYGLFGSMTDEGGGEQSSPSFLSPGGASQ